MAVLVIVQVASWPSRQGDRGGGGRRRRRCRPTRRRRVPGRPGLGQRVVADLDVGGGHRGRAGRAADRAPDRSPTSVHAGRGCRGAGRPVVNDLDKGQLGRDRGVGDRAGRRVARCQRHRVRRRARRRRTTTPRPSSRPARRSRPARSRRPSPSRRSRRDRRRCPRGSSVRSRSSVQSVGVAVPPAAVVSTALTRVSFGATAVLVIVQVASSPSANVTEVVVAVAAPVQTQSEAVKPAGPDSAEGVRADLHRGGGHRGRAGRPAHGRRARRPRGSTRWPASWPRSFRCRRP